MMIELDRRTMIAGMAAAAIVPPTPATSATAGTQHMRRLIVDWLQSRAVWRTAEPPVIPHCLQQLDAMERALVEFDRGEGCWYEFAKLHPDGIPKYETTKIVTRGALRARLRRFQAAVETDPSEANRYHVRRWTRCLDEFEQGEGSYGEGFWECDPYKLAW